MKTPPVYVAFDTEGVHRVAKFNKRSEAKAFINLGRFRYGDKLWHGIPIGPICDTKREAFDSFNLHLPLENNWL